jgi:hypothetical protein
MAIMKHLPTLLFLLVLGSSQ